MDSIWYNGVMLQMFRPLDKDIEAEAVVVGGGLAGLLTAYKLKEKGVPCVLLEANRICSGQTGATTAKVTAVHGQKFDRLLTAFGAEKARQYVRANTAAIDEYARIVEKENIFCDFTFLPFYLYTAKESEPLYREYEAAKRLGLNAELLNNVALPVKITKALRFEGQAQFNPVAFASGITNDLEIYENTLVDSVEDGVLRANGKNVRAKHIVIASHYPFVNAPGYYFLRMHQARSYAAAFENCAYLDGMYYGIDPDTLAYRNADGMLIASGCSHKTGECVGGEFAKISAKVRAIYPKAAEAARWSAQDCMPPDSVPYIGRYSNSTENMYVATGFGEWGMTSSMVAAEIVSDMICGKENENAEIFSPQRGLGAAACELVANGLKTFDAFALQRLKSPEKSVKGLKNGEGAVVRYNGRDAAVYKDENGRIHAVSPNCSHLGCRLSFNPELKSWDCPCHGSRFDIDGRVIDNPALKNLEKF